MSDEDQAELQLDTPDPPDDLPYANFEDYRARALLDVNGIGTSVADLMEALDGDEAVLRGAAAHSLGALGAGHSGHPLGRQRALAAPVIGQGPIEALRRLVETADDLVRVEAAYALVRLGVEEQRSVLHAVLDLPSNAYLSPAVAAGDLARLGDPVGFDVVASCLADDNLIVKTLGCKQLLFFVPFDGQRSKPGGSTVDVFSLFSIALADDHPDIQHLALTQLSEVPERPATLLEEYVAGGGHAAWKQLAASMLAAGSNPS